MTAIDYTPRQLREMVTPLFDSMRSRVSDEDMLTMQRAFDLACEAHKDQRRKSGEPYIIHPISVARIVGEEMSLGVNPVCAAFLHDVVEDTDYTIEDITRMFGKDIAFLVRVVTKKKNKGDSAKTSSKDRNESMQVDNFRQMLDSVKYDIRALLVKLADRLHNMRTLASMPPHKQMKIAGETDFFYAPLANRLGLYRVKAELENLSFRYRCPRDFHSLMELLDEVKLHDRPMLDRFMARVKDKLAANGIDAHIEVEYREPFSVRRKMKKTHSDFNHVEGKRFIRIVFGDTGSLTEKEMALKIYSLLTDEFKEKPMSILNYIDSPKDNGYQSLHVKLLNEVGRWEEVHISSERMRRVSRLGCIADRDERSIQRWIDNLKEILIDIAAHNHEIGFMEGVETSFYNDDITVFTPTGEAKTLPQGASVLDFAFEIHTQIGMHAKYARVNGKLSTIFTKLKRGDCLEVGTDPAAHPEESWLDHVKTYKATRNILTYLSRRSDAEFGRCPHCSPIPGDEVVGIKDADGFVTVHKRDCAEAIRLASERGESVVAFDFKVDQTLYPVSINVLAVDRSHLMTEMIDCITNRLQLPISSINTHTELDIVECRIAFFVHSYEELQTVIDSLVRIPSVDEVWTS